MKQAYPSKTTSKTYFFKSWKPISSQEVCWTQDITSPTELPILNVFSSDWCQLHFFKKCFVEKSEISSNWSLDIFIDKTISSRARFWSSDLWVMGPARFHCATLLLTERHLHCVGKASLCKRLFCSSVKFASQDWLILDPPGICEV